MSNIKQDTLKGVKWSAVERFSVQGIQFLLGLILARLLSPSDFGIIGMLAIFMSISQSLIDSGFSNALIRKKNQTDTDFSTVFYFNIVVGLICYGILFLLSPYIADFFHTPILKPILKVLALNLFVNSLIVVQIAKLTIKIDFKSQAKATSCAALTSGIVGVILAYCGYGVWALVTQSVANTCINAIIIWVMAKWRPSWVFSWESFRSLFSYGSKLMLSGIINTIYNNLSTLVIGRFYTSKDLGFYSRGQQFASLPSMNITGILQRVTFPILSKIQDDNEHLVIVYRKYIRITSLCIFFLMTLLAALSKPLILILLTEKWHEAIIYLQVFCFAMMFDHICQLNLNLLQVKGRSDLFLKLEIIKKAIAFVILVASIPLGVLAICLSKIIYTQVAVFINTYYTGKLFHLGYVTQLKDFSPYLLYSIIACLPSLLISIYCDYYIIPLVVGSAISVMLYVLILKVKKDVAYIEFIKPQLQKIKNKIK